MLSLSIGNFPDADDVSQIGQRGIGCQVGTGGTLPGVDHILGRDGFAIMEFGIFTQMEGINHPIRADIPRLGQIGSQIQFRVEGDEAAKGKFIPGAQCGGGIVVPGIGGLASG